MDSGAQPAASTFFLATILRPTFSPCRVCLAFGAAAVLGRPIAWSDQAACSGKPLCSPSPGGLVFWFFFSLDADACVRQRLYDSLAIDASDAGVSRPADEISSWVRRDF